jgi:hypothetical protein
MKRINYHLACEGINLTYSSSIPAGSEITERGLMQRYGVF